MEFTIVIDEKILEEPVKNEFSRRINELVRRSVARHMDTYRNHIETAVELYLAKRLTDKEVKSEIDKAIIMIIRERLEE